MNEDLGFDIKVNAFIIQNMTFNSNVSLYNQELFKSVIPKDFIQFTIANGTSTNDGDRYFNSGGNSYYTSE